ncbi:hypothetical protein OF83DRAFT_1175716 [Amylostereum chailletii]|nr:hypothetical protein OF83DRAFT_1175716 [Amylostereum chailletii]
MHSCIGSTVRWQQYLSVALAVGSIFSSFHSLHIYLPPSTTLIKAVVVSDLDSNPLDYYTMRMPGVSEVLSGWIPIILAPLQIVTVGMAAKELESPVDSLHTQLYHGWPFMVWITVWILLSGFGMGIRYIIVASLQPYKERLENILYPLRIWFLSGFWLLCGIVLLYTTRDTIGNTAPFLWEKGLWYVRWWGALYSTAVSISLIFIAVVERTNPYRYFQEQRELQVREEAHERLMAEWHGKNATTVEMGGPGDAPGIPEKISTNEASIV